MKFDKRLFGLNPFEAVRHDSRLRSQIQDGIARKKAYLAKEEVAKVTREKHINRERRRFLDLAARAGLGAQAFKASSLIAGALAGRHALAADDLQNKNVVFVYWSQGAPGDQWLPGSPQATRGVSDIYRDNGVSELMGFRHVDVEIPGHSSARQALGDPQQQWHLHVPTVDMRIAEVLGATSPYKMMYLGANALMGLNRGEPRELLMASHAGLPVDGPRAAINQFFNAPPVIPNDNGSEKLVAVHEKAIARFKNKLGNDEVERMQAHVDAIASLSDRLAAEKDQVEPFDVSACSTQNVNMFQETLNQGYGQADLIASALACGLTKVAVLQVGDNKAYYNMPGFYNGGVHDGGSHGGNYNDFLNCCRGHHTVGAHMIKKLRDTTGQDGKRLIDNTIVVITNCMGDGRNHASGNSPWAIATGLSGFQSGFSSGNGGNCRDFMSAIPVGLGLPAGMYVDLGGNASRANILA